jgi:hypothetical protein
VSAARLVDAIAGLDALGPQLKGALTPLLTAANGDPALAVRKIEDWYDASMDRVASWYKRRTQWVLLGFGVCIAGALNADTMAIFRSLVNDPPTRNAVMAVAQEYAKNSPTTLAGAGTGTTDGSNSAQAGTGATAVAPADAAASSEAGANGAGAASTTSPHPIAATTQQAFAPCADNDMSARCRVETSLKQVRMLGVPLNWDRNDPRTWPPTPEGWARKIIGLLLTAFAITQGAPFWFDLLNKVVKLRTALKPAGELK